MLVKAPIRLSRGDQLRQWWFAHESILMPSGLALLCALTIVVMFLFGSPSGKTPQASSQMASTQTTISTAAQEQVPTQVVAVANPAPAVNAPAPAAAAPATTYTVKSGDVLSRIAPAHGMTYPRMAALNGLSNPDKIFPGQVLKAHDDGSTPPVATPARAANPTPARTATPTRAPAPATPARNATAVSGGCHVPESAWDRIAFKESTNNWGINTGNGYYGGLQFNLTTWRAYGGKGMPHQASKAQQIAVAQKTLAKQGWSAWPQTSKMTGVAAQYPTSKWC